MTLNKKIVAVVLISLSLALLVVYLSQQEENLQQKSEYRYRLGSPEIISYDDGDKRWHIKGVELKDSGSEESQMMLETIKQAELFNRGRVYYEVLAEQGIYYRKTENLDLLGNVILTTADGDEIRTDKLFFSATDNNLVTDSGVEVKVEGATVNAPQMEIDLEKEMIDFSGGVEMNFEIGGSNNEK